MSTANNVIDFQAQQGEQLVLSAILKGADGVAADLTGATVTLVMRIRYAVNPLALAGSVSVVSANAGAVKYTGTAADTARPGEVEATFIADYGGGNVKRFPDGKDDYLLGYITPKIS